MRQSLGLIQVVAQVKRRVIKAHLNYKDRIHSAPLWQSSLRAFSSHRKLRFALQENYESRWVRISSSCAITRCERKKCIGFRWNNLSTFSPRLAKNYQLCLLSCFSINELWLRNFQVSPWRKGFLTWPQLCVHQRMIYNVEIKSAGNLCRRCTTH